MASKRFGYSTLLRPKHNSVDRLSLIGDTAALISLGDSSYHLNIDVEDLPFTPDIKIAYTDFRNENNKTYFDIGECHNENRKFSLDNSDVFHLNYMLLLYSLRQATARNIWRQTMPNYFASYVRENVFTSLTPHKLKMACLDAALKIPNPMKAIGKVADIFETYGFSRETAKLYIIAWLANIMVDSLVMINASGSPFMVSIDSLVDEANSIIEDTNLRSLASYAANKKLLFIANSHRMDVSDLAQDLIERARSSYMLSRPFCGILHATNYARATISTYTIRMITHYTKADNNRLIPSVDGGHNNIFTALDASHAQPFSEDSYLEYIDIRRALADGMSLADIELNLPT